MFKLIGRKVKMFLRLGTHSAKCSDLTIFLTNGFSNKTWYKGLHLDYQ